MGAELRDHRRPPPGLARVQADVQRTVDAGEVRLSESSPSATRFRRAGRGRVEVITFKPLSKNPGALQDARTPAARGGDRLCSHPGDLAAGPAAQTGGPRRRLCAPHRPPPADRHPGPPRVAAHRPRARRPPRLARTFAPPSRVTGLRETAHGGAVPQAARNGPSAQSFDQRGLHSTAATSDPSVAIRSHRPGNRNRTLYE